MNETQPKSDCTGDMVAQGLDGSHRQPHAPVPRSSILQCEMSDTGQDMSLHSCLYSSSFGPAALHPPTSDTSPTGCETNAARAEPLQMNILSSVSGPTENNNARIGMAEGQLSFRELPSPVPAPCAMPLPVNNVMPLAQHPVSDNVAPSSGVNSATTHNGNTSLASTEDNANISVRCDLEGTEMTARPIQGETVRGASATQQSYRSGGSSMKSEIMDSHQVRKLPRSILKLISLEMQGDGWMSLVEMYGWMYDTTLKFEKQNKDDTFLALLKEEHFQMYTLSQLRQDLMDLPRKDLLHDLDEEIDKWNAQAASM